MTKIKFAWILSFCIVVFIVQYAFTLQLNEISLFGLPQWIWAMIGIHFVYLLLLIKWTNQIEN